MLSELTNIYNMKMFTPLGKSKLYRRYISEALVSLIFMTKKRYIRIKGRTCDDGRKQRAYIKNNIMKPQLCP